MSEEIEFGQCPKCKEGAIIDGTNTYKCTEDECEFILFKNFNNKLITKDLLEEILDSEEGVFLEGFKDKEGNEYSSTVKFNKDICKFHLVYQNSKLDIECPACGGNILNTPKSYSCENNDKSLPEEEKCPIIIWKSTFGQEISEKIAIQLLKGEKTEFLNKLKNKDGDYYSAKLYLDENTMSVQKDYSIGECPSCQGEIKTGAKSYFCSNWNSDPKCDFKIWKSMSGYELSLKDVENILDKGVTAEKTFCKKDKVSTYKGKIYYNAKKKEIEII